MAPIALAKVGEVFRRRNLTSSMNGPRAFIREPALAIDAAYDQFLSDGHVAALTLFAFFPATLVTDFWPLLPGFRPEDPRWTFAIIVATPILALYGVACLILGRKSVRPVLRGRLHWPRSLAVVLAAYLLNMSLYVLTHSAVRLRSDLVFEPYSVFLFVMLVVSSPISEELCFQGYLQSRLRRWGAIPAMLVTTVLFVCIHFYTVPHAPHPADVVRLFKVFFPPLFVFALVRQYTGSLLAAISLHFLDNMTIFFTAAAR